jgi:tetratricopeptide (TPR) repeat protein
MPRRIDKLETWVEWTRQNVPLVDPVPPVSLGVPEMPWSRVAWEWAQELAATDGSAKRETLFFELGGLLSTASGYDLASRFVALGVTWVLLSELRRASEDPGLGDLLRQVDYPTLEESIAWARRTFVDLVELVTPAECPGDWTALRWETGNAYLIGRFDRAEALLERCAEAGLVTDVRLRELRAHVRYLRVFARGYGPERPEETDEDVVLLWPPTRGGELPLEALQRMILFHKGACEDKPVKLSLSDRDLLRDVIADLEKVEDQTGSLGIEYRMALARSYLETQRYEEAARYYEAVVRDKHLSEFSAMLPTGAAGGKDAVDPWLSEAVRSLVASLHLAGKADRAAAVVSEYPRVFGSDAEGLRALARLQADAGEFRAAYESLSQASEATGYVAGDWREAVILALGGIAGGQERLVRLAEAQFDSHKQIGEALASTIKSYWSRYSSLCDKAQACWQRGTYFETWPSFPWSGMRAEAITKYATAVEKELDDRVFLPFRREWLGRHAADQPLPAKSTARAPLARFLREGQSLSLGQMSFLLGQVPADPLGEALAAWAHSEQPHLLVERALLEQVKEARNPAVHDDIAQEVGSVRGKCMRLLEAIRVSQ